MSPRLPPKISLKDNWMCDLDSDIAGCGEDSQQAQPISKTPITKHGETCRWTRIHQGDRETYLVLISRKSSPQQERGDPHVDQNPQKSCVLIPTKIEEDQPRTGRPVLVEELDIDFRVPGLSYAVVEEAEHPRVQELVKGSKIILIEKHFEPTCSRITSTTHSATIRKR